MENKILHIFVKGKYWALALLRHKLYEYREVKPFWTKRLINKNYAEIYYHFGYTKNILRFKYDGFKVTHVVHKEFGNKAVKVYTISLKHFIGDLKE